MKPGQKLTDEQVRWAKMKLLCGMSQASVARALQVSVSTVARIATGVTYQGVTIEREDELREPLVIEDLTDARMVKSRNVVPGFAGMTPEESAASAARVMELAGKSPLSPQEPRTRIEPVSQELADEAKALLGIDVPVRNI